MIIELDFREINKTVQRNLETLACESIRETSRYCRCSSKGDWLFAKIIRQVLFDVRAGNSDLAKSLSEKGSHAMYQDENPHRGLLSLQNYEN